MLLSPATRIRRPLFGVALLAAAELFSAPFLHAAGAQIAVITHPERHARLTIEELRAIYLKQETFWDDGSPITAINRDAGTDVRESFSRQVFGRGSGALAAYWNERYIEGIFPPPTLGSDEAVLKYVAANKNAIGYVPLGMVDATVRVVLRIDPVP